MRKTVRKTALISLVCALMTGISVATPAAEPVLNEPSQTSTLQPTGSTVTSPAAKVNLNTADAATLESELVGVGAVKAKAIIEYRDAHGPLTSVDELLEVKGIGAATLSKNRDKLSVN